MKCHFVVTMKTNQTMFSTNFISSMKLRFLWSLSSVSAHTIRFSSPLLLFFGGLLTIDNNIGRVRYRRTNVCLMSQNMLGNMSFVPRETIIILCYLSSSSNQIRLTLYERYEVLRLLSIWKINKTYFYFGDILPTKSNPPFVFHKGGFLWQVGSSEVSHSQKRWHNTQMRLDIIFANSPP